MGGGERYEFCVSRQVGNSHSKIKAARVVFSLAEARLIDERSKKNAASAAFAFTRPDVGELSQ